MKKFITKNGTELELINSSNKNFNILVIGVVHGDEPQGRDLIRNYLAEEKNSNLGFIPILNPDGLILGTRTNANKVDLNRNFPTSNWIGGKKDNYWGGKEPASEEEIKFLINVINIYSPKLILAIHAPYKVVNYDGEGLIFAQEISQITGYPICEDIGYPTPGSLGTYAGIEKNIPTITLELDENKTINELQPSIFRVFRYLETLSL